MWLRPSCWEGSSPNRSTAARWLLAARSPLIEAAWEAALVAAWVQSLLYTSAVMFLQRPMTIGGRRWNACPHGKANPLVVRGSWNNDSAKRRDKRRLARHKERQMLGLAKGILAAAAALAAGAAAAADLPTKKEPPPPAISLLQPSPWRFELTAYGWGTSIAGNVGFGVLPTLSYYAPFSEVLQNLEAAFMGTVIAGRISSASTRSGRGSAVRKRCASRTPRLERT